MSDKHRLTTSVEFRGPLFFSLFQLAILPECSRTVDAESSSSLALSAFEEVMLHSTTHNKVLVVYTDQGLSLTFD